jgi:ABC-2 type transport system ATP-binding protein
MPPAVEVIDLVKRYKQSENNAVDGVSFSVPAGSFFALLGPNGAGKTTTISILTTTLSPTSGTVRVAGHDIVADAATVRRQVGIIFQNPSLDLNLTAEENVRFHAVLYGLYPFRPTFQLMPRAYRDEVRNLADVLGIADDMFRPLRTFSGGMRRKLEIVRSLIHHPEVLFLDEPTSGLDPASRRTLWEYLSQMRASAGTTVFLTTHYLEEAEEADAVAIMNKGHVIASGTPDDVKAALVEHYVEIDADDRDALRAELQRLGVPFREPGFFAMDIDGPEIHALLRQIETPLTLVRTHTPTLEDAYLKLIGIEDA